MQSHHGGTRVSLSPFIASQSRMEHSRVDDKFGFDLSHSVNLRFADHTLVAITPDQHQTLTHHGHATPITPPKNSP